MRPSLKKTLKSLEEQTYRDHSLRMEKGTAQALDKYLKMARESKADLVALWDDDAEFPPNWMQGILPYFDLPHVGFAGGPMIPLLSESSTRTERAAAFVSQSFFGSLWMSRRAKDAALPEERTETGLVGTGIYRRDLLLRILEKDWKKIPRGAWETYVLTRMRELGYTTLFVPEGRFYHFPRSTFRGLARQAYRSGVGRMAVFRSKPKMIIRAGSIVLPLLALAYFVEASTHAFYWPAILYLGTILVVGGFDLWNFAAILTTHASYTFGLLVGLFKKDARWT